MPETPTLLIVWHGALYPSYRKPFWLLQTRHGWDVHLLAARRWRQALPNATNFVAAPDEPISIYARRAWLRFHGATHVQPSFPSLMSHLRTDLLYIIEEPFSLMGWLGAYWATRNSPPTPFVLYTYQDLYKQYPPPFRWMERFSLQYAARVLTPNVQAGQVVESKGYKGFWDVLPQTVNLERFNYREPRQSSLFTVGYVGRLVEEKGVDLLLWAISEMEPSVRLRIAGDGPARHRLKRMADELGVTHQVAFLPPIAHEELANFYHDLDALVLPSRATEDWQEQFGRVLIEAMACGVPVIGSDCGAIPGVIGDEGLIFAQNNHLALTERIEMLAADFKLRQRFSLHGRVRVEQNYSAERVAKKLNHHLREALDHARGA